VGGSPGSQDLEAVEVEGEPNDESQDASLDVRFDDSEGACAFCDIDPPPSVWGRTSSCWMAVQV
jgi:hypothetical protein